MNVDHFKEELLALRDDLTNSDTSSKDSRKPVELDQSSVGRLSRMDAMQLQAMAGAVNKRRLAALQRIEAALTRIENDEFGYCLKCGEAIDVRRLEIDPSTPQCAACSSGA